MKQYIITKNHKFDETKVSLVGGKAIGLWKFSYLNVPKWFVLTTEFFEEMYEQEKELINTLVISEDYKSLEQVIMLKEFKNSVRNMILKNIKEGTKYAVRSSAVQEDTKGSSFAGMMASYLNIDKESILTYIKKTYLSAFSKKAVEYRKTHKLSSVDIKMAVIIQEMIEADYSGVLFTINPVTNNPDEFVISATKGLGDALVSGEVNSVDYYVNAGNIKGDDPLLSKEQIHNIVKLGYEVLASSNRFQDIEFAIKDNKIYLLQTRPIVPYSYIDITEPRTTYDNANIIESYSGTTTMLTFTFARFVYDKIYNQCLKAGHIRKKVTDSLAPYLKDMLRFYDNKIYYNLNSWYMLTSIFPGKKNNINYMENMMGVKTKMTKTKHVKMSLFDLINLGIRLKWRLDNMNRYSKKFLNKFEEVVGPYLQNDFEGYDEVKLLEVFKYIEENIVDDFTTPIINDVGAMMYYGKLTKYVNELPINDPNGFISNKVSKQGGVESAKSAPLYLAIIEKINANQNIKTDFIDMDPVDLYQKYHNSKELKDVIQKYIKEFGPRVMDELKLETITLYEDPTFLYQMLQNTVKHGLVANNIPQEYLEEPTLKFSQKMKLRRLVKKTKYFIKNRELLRLRRTYLYSVIRKIYIRLGAIFKEQDLLDDARDIFHLKKEEIEMVVKGHKDKLRDLRKIVKTRKERLEEHKEKPTFNRIVFYGDKELLIHSHLPADSILKGIPSGAGVVRGKIKLVKDPSNAILDNEIMLAERTDPGWIMLFPMCKGMIVERGSILSHSAVVARELGIVAVVGVEDATKLLHDGMEVTVDGIKGEIKIH